jgi:GT2 family glycosyltransferase
MSENIKIAAVMVIYEEPISTSKSYQSLLKYLPAEDVLIYDNSKSSQDNPSSLNYIHDPSNPGVSKAYNHAASWAVAQDHSHLLLLDSDSEFPKDAIETYRKAASLHQDRLILPHIIANGSSISPFWFKWGKSWYGHHIPLGKLEFNNKAAINSGTLIPLSQFQRTKGYNENIPLDWSDIAFCRQLSQLNIGGVKISMVVDHDLSESKASSLDAAKFRFKTFMIGMQNTPSTQFFERLLMLIWAKLKALKLSLKHRSFWFTLYYFRKLIHA